MPANNGKRSVESQAANSLTTLDLDGDLKLQSVLYLGILLESALMPCGHSSFLETDEGIRINGLVWMGTAEEMQARMDAKLRMGFSCVKLKIGAIDFESELDLIKRLRERYSVERVELRLDANGAFPVEEAFERLRRLAPYDIHSIEQPIRPGQWEAMANLCRTSPIPIALDEELDRRESYK